jgi:hypothetical protein
MKRLLFALVLPVLLLAAAPAMAGDAPKESATACAKMGCLGKDKDGNLVCTMNQHRVATRHDCGGGVNLFTDSMDNAVDPEKGAVTAPALRDKDGRPFYMLADGKTASACPLCAMGKCSKDCKAPQLRASEVHQCSKECRHAMMDFGKSLAEMKKSMEKPAPQKESGSK